MRFFMGDERRALGWLRPRVRAARQQIRVRVRLLRRLVALGASRAANAWTGLNPFYRRTDELRSCPACESGALKPLDVSEYRRRGSPRDSVTLVTGCRACGLVFVNPLPSPEELAAYYAEGGEFAHRRGLVGQATLAERREDGDRARPHISRRQAGKLRLLFEPVSDHLDVSNPPPGAKVLDYGCGPGRLLNRLQAVGWMTYGIEPATKSAFPRHQELEAPPGEPAFLLVTLHHVLEHLRNPLAVLRTLSRSMLEGGILYLSVPRLDTLPIHRDIHYCINPEGHIVGYTRDCLATLLDMAGLTAVTRPEPEGLDRMLTQGKPMRLRMFARKVASNGLGVNRDANPESAVRPAAPLRSAEAALREYHGRRAGPGIPVRLRASRLRSARRRELLAHRWERLMEELRGNGRAR